MEKDPAVRLDAKGLVLTVRSDDLEASPSEYDLAIPYFLDVDGVFSLTLERMFLVEDACVKPVDLHLTGLANYGGDDLGGEREHSVDSRLGGQALLRAQHWNGALAETYRLPLEPSHDLQGKSWLSWRELVM